MSLAAKAPCQKAEPDPADLLAWYDRHRRVLPWRARKGEKTSLFKIMESRDRTRLTSGVWARALAEGDGLATKLIDRAVKALGAGVGSGVNVLDVEAVIIGGGLGVRFGEEYVRRIEEAMMPHVFTSDHPPAVHLAKLGDLGGAVGAALLVPTRQPAGTRSRRTTGGRRPRSRARAA